MHGGSSVAISVPGRVTCILLVLLALLGDPDDALAGQVQRQRFALTLDEVRALFDTAVGPGEATEPLIAAVSHETVP